MAKGSQKERDFVSLLENELGFAAMRAPASGGATTRDLPDIIAGRPLPHNEVSSDTLEYWLEAYDGWIPKHSETWVFEAKYSSNERFYFPRSDVEQLLDFAEAWGANPRIAARFNANQTFCYGDTSWYLVRPEDVHLTLKNARIDYEPLAEDGETAEEVLQR